MTMFGFVCRSLAVVSSRSFDRAIGEQLKKQTSEQKNKKRIMLYAEGMMGRIVDLLA
jgi:hypothetical protein